MRGIDKLGIGSHQNVVLHGPADNRRPQSEMKADANYFLSSFLGGDHATKFGVGYRDTPFGFSSVRGGGATARFSNGTPIEATRTLVPRKAGRVRIFHRSRRADESVGPSIPGTPIVTMSVWPST